MVCFEPQIFSVNREKLRDEESTNAQLRFGGRKHKKDKSTSSDSESSEGKSKERKRHRVIPKAYMM